MSQYVGKLISLTDTQSVRYVGVLASISAETSTLVLKDVTVYGTEDRATGDSTVAKENEPRSEMEFKGSNVCDLQVLSVSNDKADAEEAKQNKPRRQNNRREKSRNHENRNISTTTTNDINNSENEDFFERTQRLTAETNKDDEEIVATAAYDKSSSFFDNLGASEPNERRHDRQKNVETFGESGFRPRNSGRGRGGQRGRGSRRGRGGRGGNHSNEDGNNMNEDGSGHDRRQTSNRRRGQSEGRGNHGDGSQQTYQEYVPGGQFS